MNNPTTHWEAVFQTKDTSQVSWYQEVPEQSLAMIQKYSQPSDAVLDIGGGDSRLPDALLDAGYSDITVLDISQSALEASQSRLGERASDIHWVVSDVREFESERQYRVALDRAVFHFMPDAESQAAYAEHILGVIASGGHLIMAGFSADGGPSRCSGLDIQQQDPEQLQHIFGTSVDIVETFEHIHTTPSGGEQKFRWTVFQKK